MKKKLLIFLVSIVVIGGSFFYFWEIWLPDQIEKEENSQISTTSPPALFSKSDYKIEERKDGKYIIVEKVGFSAKIPEGWKIEYKRAPERKPQYWIELNSPDLSTTTSGIITKGCKITITVGVEEENNKQIKDLIKLLKENPQINPEEISYIYKDYIFEIIEINNRDTLNWLAPPSSIKGEIRGIDIPVGEKELIDITINYPFKDKKKCVLIWKRFLENIVIK